MKFFLSLLLAAAIPASDAQQVTSLHGSGTTNPQKCYWDIMDTLMKQSKLPIRMTYRGVGSSTGQADFIGDAGLNPFNDFGSGDIPFSQENFNKFDPGTILHLPVLMGAISFFHSVPTGGAELKLNPCLLARIFNRDITEWTHEDIMAINPGLSLAADYPIKVARRVLGSSSTKSITTYLHQTCPEHWPIELVNSEITWKNDTLPCEGSGGMTECIRDSAGTIGYIDSGHGHSENLQEIDLLNFDGQYISSKTANSRGGILAAAESPNAGLPTELDQTFANVNLLNQPGGDTWPIVALSYIYVRKDLTNHLSPESAQLLKAFLEAVYTPEYNEICKETFGFVPVTGTLRDKALQEIANLTTGGGTEWFFEYSTDKTGSGIGQGDHTFSVKRDSYSEIEQDSLLSQINALKTEIANMKAMGFGATHDHDHEHDDDKDDESSTNGGSTGSASRAADVEDEDMADFERDEELTAALAMGAISVTLWAFTLVIIIVKYVLRI
ncbi:MAG: hypothetical protein SGBAC_006666 [Bacillariaceae sp.]